MMAAFALCIVLLTPYGALSNTIVADVIPHETDINTRFVKLEAALESVLVKNVELESRIERLEEENRRLKATTAAVEEVQDSQEVQETEIVGETQEDANDNPLLMKTVESINKRSNIKLPRLVVSEDTKIGFTAVISNETISHLGQGQTIVYNKVITNVGGGYHIHTGVFIAPVSGVYVFNINTMVEPGDSQFLAFVHDGQAVLHTYGNGSGESRYITTSRTVVLQVNQGGEVWVRTGDFQHHGPGRVHGNLYSSFSGWIL